MFTLSNKTTGKQAVKMVEKAIKLKNKRDNTDVTKADFFAASGLSRNSLWRYSKGEAPEHEGLMKLYRGFLSWNFDVELLP